MALDLTNLAPQTTELPKSTRGRKATPLPENIVKMVQESYGLPDGQGLTVVVPRGKDDDKGNSENVKSLTAVLRRAATSLGHGLTISTEDKGKSQVQVTFRAKDKSKRRTKEERRAEAVAEWVQILSDEEGEYADVETADDVIAAVEADEEEARIIVDAWVEAFGTTEDSAE